MLNLEGEDEAGMEERWLEGRFVAEQMGLGQKVLLPGSPRRQPTRWVHVANLVCAGWQLRAGLRQGAQRPWLSPYLTDHAVSEDFARLVRRHA